MSDAKESKSVDKDVMLVQSVTSESSDTDEQKSSSDTQSTPQQVAQSDINTVNNILQQLQQTYDAADVELLEAKTALDVKKAEYEIVKDKMLLVFQKFIAVQGNYHTQRFTLVQSQNASLVNQKNALLSQLKSVKLS